ncbi:MAG: aminoacyl-tRNA hydrolase [Elusimicrobiota bacterium]|jgi:PTH1 family peptidyl-tRNA hydrolase|nr:aminoacyl-tRNA hydrolase [Elusimicrobiota bacterium]
MPIRLFVGLGNPGSKYEKTRHNFGFEVLDEIAQSKNLVFKTQSPEAGFSIYHLPNGSKVFLLKPLTFMNNSGQPLSSFMHYYKIAPQEMFVFYDDFSIPLGKFKVKMNGSSGGHNGLKSIIAHLNTMEFPRMKLGVGPCPDFEPTINFVLSRFDKADKDKIDAIKDRAVEFFDSVCADGLHKAVSQIKEMK